MPRHPLKYPTTIGVRLSLQDRAKLRQLCQATQKPPGELLRTLIRLAQPTDLPPVKFAAATETQSESLPPETAMAR
jgi:hypothetical protein